MGSKDSFMDMVQLNYVNLDNKRIKPVTIIVPEDQSLTALFSMLIFRKLRGKHATHR